MNKGNGNSLLPPTNNKRPTFKSSDMHLDSKRALETVQVDTTMFISEKKGKITNDYEILSTIGHGGYGEVKKAKHKLTGDIRAMKIIKKESCDEGYLKSLSNEINILR